MEHPPEILFAKSGGVATLTFNRPEKRNALTTLMCEEMLGDFDRVRRDDEIKVLVITGKDPAFCSGSDLEKRMLPRLKDGHYTPLEKSRAEMLEPVMISIPRALYHVGKPTIAAVNGVAAGAGLSLATICDFRIASDRARFVASWLNVGLTPDIGATFALPRLIGVDRTLKMLYTREPMDAAEAERIRLVTQVVPHDDLMKTVYDFAGVIAAGPSVAFELARQAVHLGLTSDLDSQTVFENYAQTLCFMTEDFQEGVKAFLEKRKASYRGR